MKVHKNTLGGLRAQVHLRFLGGHRAHVCDEHQVELPHLGPVERPRVGRRNALVHDDLVKRLRHVLGVERFDEPPVQRLGPFRFALRPEFFDVIFDELIGPVATLRLAVVDERIVEGIHMARRLPHHGMHQDRRVEPDDVLVLIDHGLPPALLHVALELDASGP